MIQSILLDSNDGLRIRVDVESPSNVNVGTSTSAASILHCTLSHCDTLSSLLVYVGRGLEGLQNAQRSFSPLPCSH